MSEHITMHKISEYDLNKMLFTHNTADTSILNESSSSKLHISNQYHINSFS